MNDSRQVPPQKKIWNDPRFRGLIFQALTILAVVWVGWTLVNNTLTNMQAHGIRTGFDFLGSDANFGILMSLIPYDESMSYLRVFYVGLLNTLLVSVIGIILATIVGFLVGVARLSSNWLIAKIALVYIEIFRNIPLLLQIFFWYYFVLRTLPGVRDSLSLGGLAFLSNRGLYMPHPFPETGFGFVWIALGVAVIASIAWSRWVRHRQMQTGQRLPVFWVNLALIIGLPLIVFLLIGRPLHWTLPHLAGFNFKGGVVVLPEFAALLLALTMYTGAFIAEAVRSGILSVSKGQTEAARALGIKPGRTLQLVIIPQAMRVIIPQVTSQYLNLAKNSSLATAIGYPDLVAVFMGTTLNQTGRAVEIVAMTMSVYLAMSLLISLGMNLYNRSVALKGGRS